MPGAFGDPLRAVEAMPGVTGVASGLPYFYVRGAPPGNVGYLLDGIRLPMLYHVFAGPSVLHPAFIDRVELQRGGFPAHLGRFAGAIVDASTSVPPDEFRTEASLRLYDVGAMVAAPFASGRGRVMLGGRYSYTGLLISKLSPVKLDYWDYQAKISYDLSARDQVSALLFGAYDYSAQPQQQYEAGVQFHRLDLRYSHDFNALTRLRAAITLGSDRTRQEDDTYTYFSFSAGGTMRTHGEAISLRDQLLSTRLVLTHKLGAAAELRAGADVGIDGIHLSQRTADILTNGELLKNYPSRTDSVAGSFLELDVAPTKGFVLSPGLRADWYHSQTKSALALEPRLLLLADVSKTLTIRHSFGVVHQPPTTAPPGIPGAQQIAGLPAGLQESIQASSGFELRLPAGFTGSATLFDNVFTHLSDPTGTSGQFDLTSPDTRSLGSAIGVEMSVRRALTRRLGGFVNYTLSRTTRSHGPVSSISAFDRTHVANLVLTYDLGARFRAGVRVFYESGVPVRHVTVDGPTYDASARAPGLLRLDLRLEKRWPVFQRGYIAAVAEILNATMSQEVLRRSCNADGCSDSRFGPLFLPSLGAELSY